MILFGGRVTANIKDIKKIRSCCSKVGSYPSMRGEPGHRDMYKERLPCGHKGRDRGNASINQEMPDCQQITRS